jgi:WXG100 family type VII secretion target
MQVTTQVGGQGRTATSIEGMRQAEQSLNHTAEKIKSSLSMAEDAVAGLRATWTGDAAQRFIQGCQLWQDEGKDIVTKLIEMMNTLDRNRQIIERGEQAQTEIAQSIPVGLGI